MLQLTHVRWKLWRNDSVENTYIYFWSNCFSQVWSSDSDQTASPPSNLLMKDQAWSTGDEIKVVLLDTKGEVSVFFNSMLELHALVDFND